MASVPILRFRSRLVALVALFVSLLSVISAVIAGFLGGAGIPIQGKAGLTLAEEFGGSYAANTLSTITSLTISGGIFAIAAIILWLLAKSFGLNSHPHFGILWRESTTHWTFFVSGVPGAVYVTFYQISIDLAGLMLAMIAGMCGIIGFPVVKACRMLRRREGMTRREVLVQLKRRLVGVLCLLVATAGMGYLYTTAKLVSGLSGWDALISAMAMIALGAGIAWQFSILANMQKLIASALPSGGLSTIAAVVSASLMSSISGLVASLVTFAALVWHYPISYTWPRITTWRDLWPYCNGLAGVGIIALGTYAAKHERVKERQGFLMAAGSLMTSLIISLVTIPFSTLTLVVQVSIFILSMCGVSLCVLPSKTPTRS